MALLILIVVFNGLKEGRVLADCICFAGAKFRCVDDAKHMVVILGIFSTFGLKHSLRLLIFSTFYVGLSDIYFVCMTDLLFLIAKFLKTGA
jgi:hypothetical protein